MPHVSNAKRWLLFTALTAGSALAIFALNGVSQKVLAQATPAASQPVLCMARYTGPGKNPPQRWDDIFWENDRTAHRIYGPQLSQPAPNGEGLVTSGIDVWVKKVRTPFMDKQLMSGQQHDDHGEGQDCYDVQQTTGAGGLGIWDDTAKKLLRSANWETNGGFVNGPDIASFWVTYAPWDAGNGRKVKEKRTFTLPAGTNFTRMVDVLDDAPPNTTDLMVGIGIAKRATDGTNFKGEGVWTMDKDKGLMCYWQPEQFYKNASVGHTGVAILFDPKNFVKFVTDLPTQNLVIVKVTPGKPWAYYMGACWSLGLDFKTAPEWEKYAREFKANFDPAYQYTPASFK
jgi:hypothetical protein